MQEPPFLAVEGVEEGDDPGIAESFISEPLSSVGPVFLFYMGIVLARIRSASGKTDGLFSFREMPEEVVIEELSFMITIEAGQGKGEIFFNIFNLFQDPCSPLPQTALCSVHPVAISTQSMVKANMPIMDSPQWATVSASKKPGRDSSHWLVWMGICFLSRVPGLVVARPLLRYCILPGRNILSIVAGDMASKDWRVSSERWPNCWT